MGTLEEIAGQQEISSQHEDTSWAVGLRSAGYKGPITTEALLKECADHDNFALLLRSAESVRRKKKYPADWEAGRLDDNDPCILFPYGEG